MNVDNLVTMANQIGAFFDAMPDRAEALDGIAGHIRKFWALRMREQLTTHSTRDGGAGLSPIVRDALATHSLLPLDMPSDPHDPTPVGTRHDWDGGTES